MHQQINLYQSIFRKQRQVFSAATMAQALGIVAAALVAIHAYGVVTVGALESEVAQLEVRELALTTQLGRMDPALSATRRAELDAELKRLNATLAGQQRLIEALRQQPLGDMTGFSGYLAALSRQRTPELWLTAIAIGSTGAIELEGRSLRPDGVPEFMRRLGNEAVLANQRFDRFEIERDEENGQSIFRATSRTGLMLAATGGEPRP
jgi:hypothetical protein